MTTPNRFAELLERRYQDGKSADLSGPLNPTIETILTHRSVRSFSPDHPLPPGTLETLVAAASSASTSSMLQTWAVVAVRDPDRKAAVAALAGDQDFIRQAPLFLVFAADLARLTDMCRRRSPASSSSSSSSPPGGGEGEGQALENTDMFIMSTIDASFAAQNAAVAAESLGLGICYAGAVRNNARELAALLDMPRRTVPLMGMAVGKAAAAATDETGGEMAAMKPRIGMNGVLHREVWDGSGQERAVDAYDGALSSFYVMHELLGRLKWSQFVPRLLSSREQDGRERMREVLEERGFPLK